MEMIPQNAGHKYIAHRTHGCVRVWQEHLAEVKEIAARGSSQQFRSKGLKGKVSIFLLKNLCFSKSERVFSG